MNQLVHLDNLIEAALIGKDFAWLKELHDAKYNRENKALVVDGIHNDYAILENGVIRNIKMLIDDEMIHSVVVKNKKFRARVGDIVEYEILDMNEKLFLFGYFKAKADSSAWGKWYA